MKVQFKATVWVEAEIEEDNEQEFLELAQDGEIENYEDIKLYAEDMQVIKPIGLELVKPTDNNSHHTIEILDDENETIYKNA